jgi:hypothetical protein
MVLELRGQGSLSRLVQARKCRLGRAKILPKEPNYVLWTEGVAEMQLARSAAEVRRSIRKPLADDGFISPKYRSGNSRGRRDSLGHQLELFADKSARSPIGHRDMAARLANAKQLASDDIRTWSEHGAKHRDYDVKGVIWEGKRFGISLLEFDVQTLVGCTLPGLCKQVRCDINSGDVGAGPRGRNRRVACAASDIEYHSVGWDIQPLNEVLRIAAVNFAI